MLEDVCRQKQDQQRNTNMIRAVGGEEEGAGFLQLGEEKARGILLLISCYLLCGYRGSHSSCLEMHSDRLRAKRHSLQQRE